MYLNDQMLDSGALRTRMLSLSSNGVAYWDETVGRRLFAWDTTNLRWQMVYGDTGWRDITASLVNGWTASSFLIRRIGYDIYVRPTGLTGTSASSDTIITLDTAFRPTSNISIMVAANITDNTAVRATLTSAGVLTMPRASVSSAAPQIFCSTLAAWPTSLPGTASGTIPNA